jgi:hypothetical protein
MPAVLTDVIDFPTEPMAVTFLVGAGISVDPPTRIPAGTALTDQVLRSCFLPEVPEAIAEAHRIAGWVDAQGKPMPPRMETILGIAHRTYGDELILRLVQVLDAPYNSNHAFLARACLNGCRVVTANFDDCIEKAAAGSAITIHHFHGCIAGDLSGTSLGVTLLRIERGFDLDEVLLLQHLVSSASTLVVVGYSGSDFFDVNPVIDALPIDALSGTRVLWHVHHNSGDLTRATLRDSPGLATLLSERGAEVEVSLGPTHLLLAGLADRWGVSLDNSLGGTHERSFHFSSSQSQRVAATFNAYLELGLFAKLRQLERSTGYRGQDASASWLAEQELLWFEGSYRVARRRWSRERGVHAPNALCDERVGACLWVEGRLVRAAVHLYRVWRTTPNLTEQRSILETLGRVVEHMHRTPELRLPSRRLAKWVLAQLGDVNRSEGLQPFLRRRDLKSSLESIVAGAQRQTRDAAVTQAWFREAGSAHAALQYRHRAIRDTTSLHEIVDPTEYQRLYCDSWALGVTGDAARMIALAGTTRALGWSMVPRMLRGAEFSTWQRIRFVLFALLDWTRGPA